MPITSSAKKALRQNKTRRARNIKRKVAYKDAVKTFKKFGAAKNVDDAKAKLSEVYKTLDKAAKAKTIEKNKANRLKSRLTKLIGK